MADPDSLDAPSGENLRLAGLERELADLYRSHWTRLVRYFRQMGQSEGVAMELAQDSFVQALRALPKFRGESKLSTWLWSIAHRELLALVRRGQLDTLSSDDEAQGVSLDSLRVAEAPHLSVQDDCVRRGFARFAVDHPERAHVVVLAFVEGWTREELAEHLGRTPHAATEYLSQCKAKLKPYIENCCEP